VAVTTTTSAQIIESYHRDRIRQMQIASVYCAAYCQFVRRKVRQPRYSWNAKLFDTVCTRRPLENSFVNSRVCT